MESEQDPPPRHALQCPTGLGHARIAVREEWFYCVQCDRVDALQGDGRYPAVKDTRHNEWIEHEEFVERWGDWVYEDKG